MNRKRILLCRNQTEGLDPLLGFTSYYFNSNNNILVDLRLKSSPLLSEEVSSTAIISPTRRRTRSVVSQATRSKSSIRGYEATFRDIRRESLFSDVLVIDESYYHQLYDEYGTKKSAYSSLFSCPVLVIPTAEDRVEQVILVDDGEPSTYQQIKRMACFLPRLCLATPTTLLIARSSDKYVSAQEEKLWIEYLKLHFAHLAVYRVDHQSMHMLPVMVDYSKNALLISPAKMPSASLYQALAPITQFKLIVN
ncbi:hypothetical protein [Tunicatimonas pelagia]|uniref:hypothetical protein n=1 Tax=Tunicatimonas pelagia TaxID=931531 RepID=UPI00266646B6|nr:hypothetical protein [Tunicatimonas pelagia]WKN41147.1 hypothetical protein P0M28_19110 [Tunicatimonas pelagia]